MAVADWEGRLTLQFMYRVGWCVGRPAVIIQGRLIFTPRQCLSRVGRSFAYPVVAARWPGGRCGTSGSEVACRVSWYLKWPAG